MIDHALLDAYDGVQGEYEKLPAGHGIDAAHWELVDELLLDLHLIRHGYASDGYEKHIERRLNAVCADGQVVDRLKRSRF